MKLIQVHAPHFCAGFVSDGNVITEAAPILRYLVGRTEDFARSYFRKKGWRASVVVEAQSFKQSERAIMSEMINRVATVLAKMDGDSAVMFDYYLEQAREVIEAIRDPTDEMLNATKFAVQNKSSLRDADRAIYQAMIDAALS